MAYTNNKFCRHGIITTDVDAAKAFCSETIEWGMQEMAMGDETATMVAAADIPRAHIMLPPMEGVPPHVSPTSAWRTLTPDWPLRSRTADR
jgi:predicted enzyme related to lactoylglutathione lyase